VNLTVIRRVTFDAVHHGRALSYALEVSITGPLEDSGSVIDFDVVRDVAREVADRVIAGGVQPPTAENLVVACWRELAPRFVSPRLTRLRLWETPNQSVEYDGS
jgi:6-pyruvoyltetrahydropterin/6-carboxytetrahydropterin synthase